MEAGTSGFYFDTATDIQLKNCKVIWGNKRPDYFKHALFAANINKLSIHNLEGEAAFPESLEAIHTSNCKEVITN